ncbi:MAG: hypothetical protein AAGL17_10780 [Cyanobacteria bacterium J06576_12]
MNSISITEQAWWQEGIIYQIYVLTYADGNGDASVVGFCDQFVKVA